MRASGLRYWGRNGAGKSTLLQAMAGGTGDDSGEMPGDNLSLSHIDMADFTPQHRLSLSQNAQLFFRRLQRTDARRACNDEQIFDALGEVSGGAVFVGAAVARVGSSHYGGW